MKKYLMIAAAVMAVSAPAFVATPVMAEDAAVEAPAADVTEATLADGTKVTIKGEEVFVVGEDGTETAAPDGEHTLADGTTIEVLDGKVVHGEEEHSEEAAH